MTQRGRRDNRAFSSRMESDFVTSSPQETHRLGILLGERLSSGNVVLLTGELGAGKTTFSKGVGVGLGVLDPMTSPTFTLIAEYEGRVPLAHMDLYRLSGDSRRLEEIGWDDYLESDYAVLVEWPIAGMEGLADVVHVTVERTGLLKFHERKFHCVAMGQLSVMLLQEWVNAWQSL